MEDVEVDDKMDHQWRIVLGITREGNMTRKI